MKIKVSETTNIQLDWLVAKIELPCKAYMIKDKCWINVSPAGHEVFNPTTNWSLAGPIIEREKLSLDMLCAPDEWRSALMEGDFYDDQGEWIEGSSHEQTGPTPLVAAMRCHVASKLGDTIEVPDGLGE